jgi:antitoxin component of MazEF toxin-antitoxin module
MPLAFKSTVMKVGNSLVLVLPKPLCDGFGIKKGSVLNVTARDDGIYIPLFEHDGEKHGVQPAVSYPSKAKSNSENRSKSTKAQELRSVS